MVTTTWFVCAVVLSCGLLFVAPLRFPDDEQQEVLVALAVAVLTAAALLLIGDLYS